MGLYIFTYAIEAHELKSVLGSGDKELLNNVAGSYAFQHAGGDPEVQDALAALIDDEPTNTTIPSPLRQRFEPVVITQEMLNEMEKTDDENAYFMDSLKGILDNMDFCLKNGLDLISFCH